MMNKLKDIKNKKWYEKIINFISNPKKRKLIIFVILGLSILINFVTCDRLDSLKTQLSVSQHNNKALRDSVQTVKNKVGGLQQEKISYITTIDELENFNKQLKEEVDKQKGRVLYISNMNASLKNTNNELSNENNELKEENKTLKDSLSKFKNEEGEDVFKLDWDFSKQYSGENFRIVKGYTSFKIDSTTYTPISMGSRLETFNFGFDITTGLREEDDMLKIFVKSNYPDLEFTNIQGSLIDPHKSDVIQSLMHEDRWTFGVQMGAGFGYFKGGQMRPTVYIGFGGQYKLFGF